MGDAYEAMELTGPAVTPNPPISERRTMEPGAIPAAFEGAGVTRYHLRNGLYFDKQDDGYVRIAYAKSGRADESPQAICEVPPHEWASVVAFLCNAGENGRTHRQALEFHLGIG